MTAQFALTGGECLRIDCGPAWTRKLLQRGLAGESFDHEPDPATPTTVHLVVEVTRQPFVLAGADRVTRGAWSNGTAVLLENACSSGFSLLLEPQDDVLLVRARWAPPWRTRLASALLRQRASLLMRAVLLQYPVMWWSGVHGRAPLHVSALVLDRSAPLLAGPSGVGKSTLVDAEIEAGHRATCDNLAVSDGRTVFGILEPRRTSGGSGPRTSHGRREVPFAGRLTSVRPDRVVAVSLSETAPQAVTRALEGDAACRALVSGTYMAGELRRYWAFAATLAAGTGLGPTAPPVEAVARRLTGTLPCLSLALSRTSPARLSDPTGPAIESVQVVP
ncbi:MAG: hypothetical protein QOD91_1331 [Frankiales bacterium]|nr:hypothetical protein [Frankiales bacterium]